jgi:DNA invertase Pin-like site-specific DNA recombinase
MTQQDHTNDTVPQSGRAAIYARVAPGARTQATLIALANEHGFSNERIIVYEDVHVSSGKPLAQRGALSDLLTAIMQEGQAPEQERIHAVFVSAPHRLFRDPASVDIATFLRTCAAHNVQIVTPDITYDLTAPGQITLFQSQCEQARQYIAMQVKRLNAGMRQKKQAEDIRR